MFAAHRVKSLLKMLTENNIKIVYVPAGCTGELQPLDKSFNDPYKKEMKQHFTKWYAGLVKEALERNENVNINLQTSLIKEVHANWIISTHSEMEKKKDIIISGFEQAGILDYI